MNRFVDKWRSKDVTKSDLLLDLQKKLVKIGVDCKLDGDYIILVDKAKALRLVRGKELPHDDQKLTGQGYAIVLVYTNVRKISPKVVMAVVDFLKEERETSWIML